MISDAWRRRSEVIGKYASMAFSAVRQQGFAAGVGQVASEVVFDRRHGLAAFLPREVSDGVDDPTFRIADAVQYQGVDPRLALRILEMLPMETRSNATFVDYGCGKARGLAVGILAGFRRLVGVEVSRELAALADRNLAVMRQRNPGVDVQIHVMDATRYQPPEGPLVAFLYNPFVGLTLERVVQRLEQHATHHPVWVVYINPRGRSAFLNRGFRERSIFGSSEALLLQSGPECENVDTFGMGETLDKGR